MPFKVFDPDDLDGDDVSIVIVCILATEESPFADDVIGVCATCRRDVKHRPDIPQPHTLCCTECFAKKAADADTDDIGITTSGNGAWFAPTATEHGLPRTKQACCAPAPDRSGRCCDKPSGHDGPHWTYGGNTLTWNDSTSTEHE